MNILKKIVAKKRAEISQLKSPEGIKRLSDLPFLDQPTRSLSRAIGRSSHGVIAEIKRASPSAGKLIGAENPAEIARGYKAAGAAAISVLTEQNCFKGKPEDLMAVKAAVDIPVLRKDFIVDESQLIEARGIGADAILLIAACLEPTHCKRLAKAARRLSMEVLLEVHNRQELEAYLCEEVNIVGVNNRNLKDFSISLKTSLELIDLIPDDFHCISESGLKEAGELKRLQAVGFDGFLIGTQFVKSKDPVTACQDLLSNFPNPREARLVKVNRHA